MAHIAFMFATENIKIEKMEPLKEQSKSPIAAFDLGNSNLVLLAAGQSSLMSRLYWQSLTKKEIFGWLKNGKTQKR